MQVCEFRFASLADRLRAAAVEEGFEQGRLRSTPDSFAAKIAKTDEAMDALLNVQPSVGPQVLRYYTLHALVPTLALRAAFYREVPLPPDNQYGLMTRDFVLTRLHRLPHDVPDEYSCAEYSLACRSVAGLSAHTLISID